MASNGSDSEVEILGVGERIMAREDVRVLTSPDVIEVAEGEGHSGTQRDSEESSANSSNEGSDDGSESGDSSEEGSEPVEAGTSTHSPSGKEAGEKSGRELYYTEIRSNVTKTEAVELRNRYYIPDEYQVRVPKPNNRMNEHRDRALAIHIPTLRAGFRFPIPDPVLLILQLLNLCPTQLLPNSYSLILSFVVFMKCLGHPPSYANFYELFVCQPSVKSGELERSGFYFLSARQGRKIFTTPTSSYGKDWKRKWLYVRAPEGEDFDVQRDWQENKGILPKPVEETTLIPEELERILKEVAPPSSYILCQEDVLVAAGLSPAPAKEIVALGTQIFAFSTACTSLSALESIL